MVGATPSATSSTASAAPGTTSSHRTNRPAAGTWAGKPDVYHAYQATLFPRLPVAPTLGAALAAPARQ